MDKHSKRQEWQTSEKKGRIYFYSFWEKKICRFKGQKYCCFFCSKILEEMIKKKSIYIILLKPSNFLICQKFFLIRGVHSNRHPPIFNDTLQRRYKSGVTINASILSSPFVGEASSWFRKGDFVSGAPGVIHVFMNEGWLSSRVPDTLNCRGGLSSSPFSSLWLVSLGLKFFLLGASTSCWHTFVIVGGWWTP